MKIDAHHTEQYDIYRGDFTEILPNLHLAVEDGQRIHIITDPPYEDELHEAAKKGRVKNLNEMGFDGVNAMRDEYARIMVECATGWLLSFTLAEGVRAWRDAQQAAGAKWDTCLAWIKPDSTPRMNGQGAARGFENITSAWCGPGYKTWNGGGKRGVYTHFCNWPGRVPAKKGGHPTEKPLGLMRELIADFTQPGDLVIDPFMGSGTTGEACLVLGRRFIGIEMQQKWFDWSKDRLDMAVRQDDLFPVMPYKKQESLMDLPVQRQPEPLSQS